VPSIEPVGKNANCKFGPAGIPVFSLGLISALLVTLLGSCGGNNGNGATDGNGGGGNTPPPTTSGGTVTVTAGQETSGINIEVGTRTPSLSLVAVGVGDTAGSVGVAVKQGTTNSLLLAGSGLVSGTQYSVSHGTPADVTVAQPAAGDFCTTTDGTPCVSLSVSVNPDAALGPRNIMVTNANSELAVFAGGLIVAPGP
jgi:hypothetical protein